MSKYIERNVLPQFKYYNFCGGEKIYWNVDNESGFLACDGSTGNGISYTMDDLTAWDELLLCVKAIKIGQATDEEANKIRMGWFSPQLRTSAQKSLLQFCNLFINCMYAKEHYLEVNQRRFSELLDDDFSDMSQRKTLIKLNEIADIIEIAKLIPKLQGMPSTYDSGESYIPKLLLINAELHKEYKRRNDLKLEYEFLKKCLMNEEVVVVVNGESAERKMSFLISYNHDEIQFYMLDPINGLSIFLITKQDFYDERLSGNGDDAVIISDKLRCHPRGNRDCFGDDNKTCYYNCHDSECTCLTKQLNVVAAIVYAYQEYKRKTMNATSGPSAEKASGINNSKNKTKPFIPDGMMRLYDIKLSQDELIRINKYNMYSKLKSQYTSSEKCPHTRRGTMRYNPKTGKRDIKVKGSIIHKDKYTGFASTDRVNQ